jgi:hypothetical protein
MTSETDFWDATLTAIKIIGAPDALTLEGSPKLTAAADEDAVNSEAAVKTGERGETPSPTTGDNQSVHTINVKHEERLQVKQYSRHMQLACCFCSAATGAVTSSGSPHCTMCLADREPGQQVRSAGQPHGQPPGAQRQILSRDVCPDQRQRRQPTRQHVTRMRGLGLQNQQVSKISTRMANEQA